MKKPTSIEARSIVSGRNLEPYIQLVLKYDDGTEEMICQWNAQEAYHHVTAVLCAVEAANTDSFLVSFLTSKLGIDLNRTGQVLQDFRAWRERRQMPERPQ